jgi:hypothetical protein
MRDPTACTVQLIQGPPGTGKSTAAAALLKLAASLVCGRPLLATADSNAGADTLLENLLQLGVHACRVGRPGREGQHLSESTIDARLAMHPAHEELQREREQLRALSAGMPPADEGLCSTSRMDMKRMLRDGWRRVRSQETQMTRDILDQCEVVCATLVGCGAPALQSMRFPLVVVDE